MYESQQSAEPTSHRKPQHTFLYPVVRPSDLDLSTGTSQAEICVVIADTHTNTNTIASLRRYVFAVYIALYIYI